ncbi:MAG: hypothetical protein U9N77_10215 [Thermodesulfobacteriota bacterium]|nr:hypothetical protein [Thermodesulfobacteriota bacterium]
MFLQSGYFKLSADNADGRRFSGFILWGYLWLSVVLWGNLLWASRGDQIVVENGRVCPWQLCKVLWKKRKNEYQKEKNI